MNGFLDMQRQICSSRHYEEMLRFATPLKEHFGVNHFWYYKIKPSGHYTYVGTHRAWNEFCYKESLLKDFPCIKHPSLLEDGISLMKASANLQYQQVLKLAWEQFQINFNLNLVSQIQEGGIEAFGFATQFNDVHADERLLNKLPALRLFIRQFRRQHPELFVMLDKHSLDLSTQIGINFYDAQKTIQIPLDYERFLHNLGLKQFLLLTSREREILSLVAYGYPATHIAEQLHLATRTIENYLAVIKCKLDCKSKLELMQKAQETMLLFEK